MAEGTKRTKGKCAEKKTGEILDWMEIELGASGMRVKHVPPMPLFTLALAG